MILAFAALHLCDVTAFKQPAVSDSEKTEYDVTFTPEDTANYKTVDLKVKVGKASQDAPALDMFNVSDETISGKADGIIGGLTDKMESSTDEADGFAPAAGESLENLAPGTYYVRFAADDNHEASEPLAITVAAGRKLSVTWINEDGTVLETDEDLDYGAEPHYDGETPVKEATPEYSYSFSGWDKELDPIIDDVTFTARFTENLNEYTITFDTDGGSGIAPITQGYGTAVTAPDDPEKDGFTFAGWDTEIPEFMPAGDITVKAKWIRTEYTITLNDLTVNDVEWVNGSTVPLKLVVNRNINDELTFGNFAELIVDGKAVDGKNYTTEEGSLKLTLSPDYLNTLAVGEHSVKVVFTDNSAECRLTVLPDPKKEDPEPEKEIPEPKKEVPEKKEKPAETKGDTNPNTGAAAGLGPAVLAAGAAAIALKKKRRK